MLPNLVNRADVGMVQGRSGAGFAAEAFEGLGILGRIVGEKLEGDEAAELSVFGFVDHTHATAAEQFEDAVVGDGLADHRRSIVKESRFRWGQNRKRSYLRRTGRVRQCEFGDGKAVLNLPQGVVYHAFLFRGERYG